MQQAKRILLIGLGRWGVNHLRVLQSMPIELFVAETDPERLKSANLPASHQAVDAASFFPIIDAAVGVSSNCQNELSGKLQTGLAPAGPR